MKIIIKAKNLELTQPLEDFINEKINSIGKFLESFFKKEKYYDSFFGKGKPRVEAWVEIEKTTRHHKKGPYFRAEVQMHLPKHSIRAEAEREDLKTAIVEVKDELQVELKKYKERAMVIARRKTRSTLSPLAKGEGSIKKEIESIQ